MNKVDDILVQKDNENNANYLCCDLKSFYASVECIERGLDPLSTNLVVADESRTEKICNRLFGNNYGCRR